jgi:hypothetical protein
MEKKQSEKKAIEKLHAPTQTTNDKPPASKAFFGDAIKKMTDDQVITPYTRDRLLGLLESGVEKDYGRFKKHFHDLLDLHETIDEDL